MKRFFCLLTLLAFVVAGTMAIAAEKAQTTSMKGPDVKAQKTVHCCVKGECKQAASDADCAKAGGKVVKSCAECK
jgi:hypothetical protein